VRVAIENVKCKSNFGRSPQISIISPRDLNFSVVATGSFGERARGLRSTTLDSHESQKSSANMPQAQPELKKVRYTPYNPAANPRKRETRRTRNGNRSEENRDGKSKEDKWTDPLLQYLDKRLFVQLNGSRRVIGVLRGYDVSIQFV
jgi:hypothetical protein